MARASTNTQPIGPAQQRCRICGKPLTWQEARVQRTCGAWKCRASYREQQLALRRQQEEQFRQRYLGSLAQATAVRDASAAAHADEDVKSYAVVIIPANQRRIVPLPRKRRYKFAKEMLRLVETAGQDPSFDPLASQCEDGWPPAALPIVTSACATCQGRCCLKAGTRAHMDIAAVGRYMHQHADAEPRDVVDAYCRHLPRETYEASCVFHSAAGCTLPPAMRPNVCLGFVCAGLKEIRDRITRRGQAKFFLAAMSRQAVVRWRFVESTGHEVA